MAEAKEAGVADQKGEGVVLEPQAVMDAVAPWATSDDRDFKGTEQARAVRNQLHAAIGARDLAEQKLVDADAEVGKLVSLLAQLIEYKPGDERREADIPPAPGSEEEKRAEADKAKRDDEPAKRRGRPPAQNKE